MQAQCDTLHDRYPQHSVNNSNTAYGALSLLLRTLDDYTQHYTDKNIDLKHFKIYSSAVIKKAYTNDVLTVHRGIKEILANLLFALGTAGIGYMFAAFFTQRPNPIKCNTDSVNILIETEKALLKI